MATLFRFPKPAMAAAIVSAVCVLPLMVFSAGCTSTASAGTTLGTLPAQTVETASVREILHRSAKKGAPAAAKLLAVKGTIIEKCPVAGCWFMLRDHSGVIKVDTKNAGFVVTEIPLGTSIEVVGTLPDAGPSDAQRSFAANGLRY